MGLSTRLTPYRFTFGPWNISTGADPFGPPVRPDMAFALKLREYKKLGFDGVQFHDDDVVPADLDAAATQRGVAEVKKILSDEGLFCEFIAPRLWEHPNTIDGAYTANSAAHRTYALDRSKRAVDIANAMVLQDMVIRTRNLIQLHEAGYRDNILVSHDHCLCVLGRMGIGYEERVPTSRLTWRRSAWRVTA